MQIGRPSSDTAASAPPGGLPGKQKATTFADKTVENKCGRLIIGGVEFKKSEENIDSMVRAIEVLPAPFPIIQKDYNESFYVVKKLNSDDFGWSLAMKDDFFRKEGMKKTTLRDK